MTQTDKLNLIRERCIAANPEIGELKLGCVVIWTFEHQLNHRSSTTRHKRGMIISAPDMFRAKILFEGNTSISSIRIDDRLKILGRPIRLADVLLAIEKKNGDGVGIDAEGYFIERKNTSEGIGLSSLWNGKGTHRINRWNLRADDLQEQSEETINFLYELLK